MLEGLCGTRKFDETKDNEVHRMDRQKLTTTILIILEAGLLCAVLVCGVLFNATGSTRKPVSNKQSEQTADGDETSSGQSTEGDTEGAAGDSAGNSEAEGNWFASEERETFSAAVEQKLAAMTTEQKVAQLFLTSPEALTGVDRVTISGNGTRDALAQYPVGGLIYSQTNFIGLEQAEALISGAQGHSDTAIGLPLFILISEDASLYADFATLSLTAQESGALVMELGGTPALSDGIQTCTYTNSLEVVEAIKDGMNMVYAPTNFTEIYGAVLTAVNDGTISQVRLENAVGRVLTEKLQ